MRLDSAKVARRSVSEIVMGRLRSNALDQLWNLLQIDLPSLSGFSTLTNQGFGVMLRCQSPVAEMDPRRCD